MHLQKNKKIFIYILFFTLFTTISNKHFGNIKNLGIVSIYVSGIQSSEKDEVLKKLNFLKNENLFFLDKSIIKKIIFSDNTIENLFVKKKYPSSLIIEITKARVLAKTLIGEKNYFIGSNGKLFDKEILYQEVPFVFGSFELNEFLSLKKKVDNSKFEYSQIKNLFFFPSKRWDIETKKDLLIKLPSANVEEALSLLTNFLNKNDMENIKMIDLRQTNQLIINER